MLSRLILSCPLQNVKFAWINSFAMLSECKNTNNLFNLEILFGRNEEKSYICNIFILQYKFLRIMRIISSRLFVCLSMLLACLAATAQTQVFTVKFPADADLAGWKVLVDPLNPGVKSDALEMKAAGNTFSCDVTPSAIGIYEVVCIKDQTQIFANVYSDKAENLVVPVRMEGKNLIADNNENNKALTAFGRISKESNMRLWSNSSGDAEYAKALLMSIQTRTDSVLNVHKCSPDVEKYIRIGAYVSTYNAYISLPRVLKCSPKNMPFKASEVMARPETILDSPIASLFTLTPSLIANFMPKEKKLAEQIGWLYGNFKCREIVDDVAASAIGKYIARFNYAENYDAGLAEIKELTETYSLSDKYLKTFIANKATVKGNPFPSDVVFKDAAGNVKTIEEFKGKYVYIDMWASWCVPCRKEIPHLQRLEKELQNPDVVFLSISVDAKPEPWKKAMTDLNLHGNQWHDTNSKLAKALNVRGIPFFIIYDKEGKLYMYDAPRPSHPQLKNYLEGLK